MFRKRIVMDQKFVAIVELHHDAELPVLGTVAC
jgi:hypothetical protein